MDHTKYTHTHTHTHTHARTNAQSYISSYTSIILCDSGFTALEDTREQR